MPRCEMWVPARKVCKTFAINNGIKAIIEAMPHMGQIWIANIHRIAVVAFIAEKWRKGSPFRIMDDAKGFTLTRVD